ncbi:MAG: carbamoyltransferase C-terminal domain-containing protein [Pseudonocardiaceae bacterium]
MSGGNGATYVVSTYLSPPGLMAFTTHRHDQNVALWCVDDDRITLVRYWEIERLSGFKHHELPLYETERLLSDLIDRLIAQEGLTRADIADVWGTPGLEMRMVMPEFDRQGLSMHSLAHLFSGLCMNTRCLRDSTIVALAMDGGPDFTLEDEVLGDQWYSGAVSHRGEVVLAPVESPGLLWQASQRHFKKEPGTLMALAHASPVSIEYDCNALLAQRYWGGYALMGKCYSLVRSIIDVAESTIRSGSGDGECTFSRNDLIASAVMKIIQSASIAIAKRSVNALLEMGAVAPEEAFLSLSGGYALNCPTNSYLISEYGFRGLLTPPCANDSGQALGIGLLGFFARGNLRTRDVDTRLPYAGESRLDVPKAMSRWSSRILDVKEFDEEVFVEDLQRQPVAWVDGAAEVGPRALGHRSLLGDPRWIETKRTLNHVKQRQWWRPVAPIVLEDHVADWFVDGRPSPFMLETFSVAPERRPLVPAIMHLDGSARIQTLSAADEPFLAHVIAAFHNASGVPIVCNTSLNDRGEPIANDASDAVNFCVRKGIEVAYIGRRRFLLDVNRQAPPPDSVETRPLASLYSDQNKRPSAVFGSEINPEILFLLYFWPRLHCFIDTPTGPARLRSIARLVAEKDDSFRERAEQFMLYWRDLLEGRISHGEVDLR